MLSGTNDGDVRQKNTNKKSLESPSKTICFKIKKHEVYHSLIVAVFFRAGYWKCHTLMGVDNEHDLHFPLFFYRSLLK